MPEHSEGGKKMSLITCTFSFLWGWVCTLVFFGYNHIFGHRDIKMYLVVQTLLLLIWLEKLGVIIALFLALIIVNLSLL